MDGYEYVMKKCEDRLSIKNYEKLASICPHRMMDFDEYTQWWWGCKLKPRDGKYLKSCVPVECMYIRGKND